ncbi:hypothetical protein AAY473_010711 [Plecturocebus cupreus]
MAVKVGKGSSTCSTSALVWKPVHEEFNTSLANMVKPCYLLKNIQKLARHGGVHLLSQLLWRLKQENRLNPGGGGCSELRLHHCIPASVTQQDSISDKQTNKTGSFIQNHV